MYEAIVTTLRLCGNKDQMKQEKSVSTQRKGTKFEWLQDKERDRVFFFFNVSPN